MEIDTPTEAEIADFRESMAKFDDLERYTDKIVSEALVVGRMQTGGRCWGAIDSPRRKLACQYYTAHILALLYPDGSSFDEIVQASLPISSVSVGSQSVSFATPQETSSMSTFLNTTAYGQMYLQLAEPIKVRAITVG